MTPIGVWEYFRDRETQQTFYRWPGEPGEDWRLLVLPEARFRPDYPEWSCHPKEIQLVSGAPGSDIIHLRVSYASRNARRASEKTSDIYLDGRTYLLSLVDSEWEEKVFSSNRTFRYEYRNQTKYSAYGERVHLPNYLPAFGF